jgi:hypothetical protein
MGWLEFIFVAGGVLAAVLAPVAVRVWVRWLHKRGRTASGYVIALDAEKHDDNPMYWAQISCGEGRFNGRVSLSSQQYEALYVGSPVRVVYLPGRPRSVWVLDWPG